MKKLNLVSNPVSCITGELTIPGDKSISHRSIIFGAVAKGTTIIDGFLNGEDCMATLEAFKAMGVGIQGPTNHELVIEGVGKYGLQKPNKIIDCGNSGTTMRLLAGLLVAQSFDSQLTGDESLLKRPMLRISKPLTQMGAEISTHQGKPPLVIKGGKKLKAIDYQMPEASAQVKSCILLAGLYAEGVTRIRETGISRNHTELMLKAFSYPIRQEEDSIEINSVAECVGTKISIPGDLSSAAFFIVAATIIPGSKLFLRNVGMNPTRIGIINLLTKMGADISFFNRRQYGEEKVADLQVNYSPLKGIDIPSSMVSLTIDEFPILFIAAACAQGQTTLKGAKELRLKESDRIGVMAAGLTALGIKVQELEEGIIINGGSFQGGVVESHGDHRIAMSFVIAGAASHQAVTIKNCAAVATSFPAFVSSANTIHFQIEEIVDDR